MYAGADHEEHVENGGAHDGPSADRNTNNNNNNNANHNNDTTTTTTTTTTHEHDNNKRIGVVLTYVSPWPTIRVARVLSVRC